MSHIDQLFVARMAHLASFLFEGENGIAFKPADTSLPWVKTLIRYVHDGGPPSEYVLEALWCIATECCDVYAQYQPIGVDDEMSFDDIPFDAADTFSRINTASDSLTRRWLMWKSDAHWRYMDEVAKESALASCFRGVIAEAMRAQVYHIFQHALDCLAIHDAENELRDAEQKEVCPTSSTTSSN